MMLHRIGSLSALKISVGGFSAIEVFSARVNPAFLA
jgi:hypothetical protein